MTDTRPGILQGIKILDMSNVLSGPFTTVQLSLLGAEVIKIENPSDGDLARKLGCLSELNKKLMGTSFLAQNANKKSLTLNVKTKKGKNILLELVESADVVVENFRPGVMKRLGFDYDSLAAVNPRIILCSISGFGQTGPDAGKPAYDQIIQGMSGVMSINGTKEVNPLRCGFPVCDTVAGLNAAFAIVAALFHRERTGRGQFIDVAMLDSILPLMGWVAANLLIGNQKPQLLGNENFTAAPSGVFRTRDDYLNIAANKQEQWEILADLLGLSDLKEDPRFKERDIRKANRFELKRIIEEKLQVETTEYWVDLFNAKGVPAGAVLSLEEALSLEQLAHREIIATIDLDGFGPVKLFNSTAKFSECPGTVTTAPPKLSEHTEEILGSLGYDKEEIEKLRAEMVI